jgi:uncharacterized protein involved in exopolysaccharide biosynthesis
MSKTLTKEPMVTTRGPALAPSPVPLGAEAGGLPLRKLAAALLRSRWFVFGTMALGFLVGAFLAVVTPNTYLSQGKFLFTSGSENIQIGLEQISETKSDILAAQAIYVLRTDNLLRRVAERVNPERILASYQPKAEGSGIGAVLRGVQTSIATSADEYSVEDAMRLLRKNLAIDQPRFTNILVATYLANDRQLAKDVLDAFMEEAQKYHQEQYDDPKKYDQARKQAEDAQTALALKAQARRDFLEQEAQVTNTFEYELQHAQAAEGEAASELDKNAAAIASASRRVEELDKHIKTLPVNVVIKRRADVVQKAVDTLLEQIGKLEAQKTRIEVESAQGNPPEVEQISRQIAQLDQKLKQAQERQKDAPEIPFEERNPEHVKACEEVATLRSQLVGYRAVTEQLQSIHTAAAARLRRLREIEPRYSALREDLERAQAENRNAEAAYQAAERKRVANIGNFSTLKVIENPSLPLEKEGPNRGRLLLGGWVLGLFLALAVVVLRSLPDTVVRTPQDLEDMEGIALIGMMPRSGNRNLRRHEAARERGF